MEAQVTRILPPDQIHAEQPDLENPPQISPEDGPLQPVNGTATALYDRSGATFLRGATIGDAPELLAARQSAAAGARDLRTVVTEDGAAWRVLTVPITWLNQPFGIIQVARNEADSRTALSELLVLMAVGIPATLVLAVAIGMFLAGRALDPIDRITTTAAQIGASDLSQRLALRPRRDEVGRMAATFDAMLDRLEAAFERQRRFTADASHELRTPLALMITQAELALEQQRSPHRYREALEAVCDDGRRMTQLLGDLLTLARADAEQVRLQSESLDLVQLVVDTVVAMLPLATARDIRLGARTPQQASIAISGDQTRLTQLMVNVLDNALKYTPSGGVITVVVEADGPWATVQVTDTGIGIGPEHLAHIFDRFYRVDDARARSDGGAGLGLAISRWIAEAHGGSIEADSRLNVGSTFTIRLPVAPASPAMTGSSGGDGRGQPHPTVTV